MEMISINSNKATSSVKIDNNISINPYKEIEKVSEKVASDTPASHDIDNRIDAYKIIIKSLVNRCYSVKDGRHVLKAEDLIAVMEALVGEKVRVNVSPECLGKIYKIDSIITETKDIINVKYNRADIFEELAELKISTKYVMV
jgi:hypothetical protein